MSDSFIRAKEVSFMHQDSSVQMAESYIAGQPEDEENIEELIQDDHEEEKRIDFQKLLKEYKERAENKLSYTIQQVDDVIFINKNHVVALEYIYYANIGGNYHRIIKHTVNEKSKDLLGLQNYIIKEKDNPKEKSAFKNPPRFYSVLKKDYLNEHRTEDQYKKANTTASEQVGLAIQNIVLHAGVDQHDCDHQDFIKDIDYKFMPTADDQAMTEGVVSLWKITKTGQLCKTKTQSFQYKGYHVQSKDQQARLQLSTDKQYVSLCLHNNIEFKDDEGKTNYSSKNIQFFAWNTEKLEPIQERIIDIEDQDDQKKTIDGNRELRKIKESKFQEENLQKIQQDINGHIKSMRIVGNSQYVIRESIKIKHLYYKKDFSKRYINWEIFNIISGQKVYEIDNIFESKVIEEEQFRNLQKGMGFETDVTDQRQFQMEDEDKHYEVRLISILPKEKRFNNTQNAYGEEVDEFEPYQEYGSEHEKLESEYKSDEECDTDLQQSILEGDKYEDDEQYDGGETDINPEDEDLDIVFIFTKDLKTEKSAKDKAQAQQQTNKDGIKMMKGKGKSQYKLENKKDKVQDWVWTKKKLNLREILQNENLDQSNGRKTYILEKGNEKFNEIKEQNKDYFYIPREWFSPGVRKNWEHEVEVTSNRYFEHFGFINRRPKISKCLLYDNTEVAIDKPFYQVFIQQDQQTNFVRNQTSNNFLTLVSRIENSSKATVYYDKNTKESIAFNNDYEFAWQDVQTNKVPGIQGKEKKIMKNEGLNHVFLLQSITISGGDQEIWLKTHVKAKKTEENANFHDEIQRKSIIQSHKGIFPVFVYNIGPKKLVIQNTLQKNDDGGKNWVYELSHHEEFICFLDYTSDEDLGFYPKGLRIEGCSKFAYITINSSKKTPVANINILLVDPYQDVPQICTFKSSKTIDLAEHNEINDTQQMEEDYDVIIKGIMYSTKQKKDDNDYDLKVIIQFPNHYRTYKLRDDEQGDGDDIDYCSFDDEITEFYDEEEDEMERSKLARVPFIQDNNGYIYFVMINEGESSIYEINPKNDKEPLQIYTLQSHYCIGFGFQDDSFYFMDEFKQVLQLQRVKEQRTLYQTTKFQIKDKDRPNFKDITLYGEIIISNKYLIQQSKVFYLYEEKPLASGILDMEELSHASKDSPKRKFSSGPYRYNGSNTFVIVYQSKDQPNSWYQTIYALPDSTNTQLIGDYQNQVDMSTFLKNGDILMKLGQRFMIYNTDGIFKDEIQFGEDIDADKSVVKMFDRRKLHKSSNDYQYFLFEDSQMKTLNIQTLELEGEEYVFRQKYDLNLKSDKVGELYKKLGIDIEGGIEDKNIDAFFKQLKDGSKMNIQVEEKGEVIFTINIHEEKETDITVYVCKFSLDGDFKDFQTKCQFDSDAKTDVLKGYDSQLKNIKYLQEIEKDQQRHLSQAFKNPFQTFQLKKEQQRIEKLKKNTVFSEIYDGDLLLVQCGRFIKFAQFEDSIWAQDENLKFENAKINFEKDIQIQKIWGTQKNYNLQIIAIDDVKKILFILTWDFGSKVEDKKEKKFTVRNIESSMLQFQTEPNTNPQNYIVKGMNEKMNYFLNKYQIFDLEFNIPLQTTNFNSLKGEGIQKHINQRKIFKDPSKSLCIDNGHILNFPLSRMDLIFWMNITGLGEDPDQIIQNTTLQNFNVIYDGSSLLHHFAGNQHVIEAIHEKYTSAKKDGTLTNEQINMPLVILNPDPQGKTALDLCLDMQVPRSFDCMIDMLEDFPDFCLSKMMLKAIPTMIGSSNRIINNFFNSATYKPPLMKFTLNIPWPENQNEYVFASPTSLITEDSLNEQLKTELFMQITIQGEKGREMLLEKLFVEEEHGKDKLLRDQQLSIQNKHSAASKRLQIEAVDFDWIFKGENAKTLLALLDDQNSDIFLQKSIKIFIEFMWKHYWPEIMKQIFVPFLFYLVMFIYLCSSIAGSYLKKIKENSVYPDQPYHDAHRVWLCAILEIFCSLFLFYFTRQEFQEFIAGPKSYVQEFWNWFDLFQVFLNTSFLITLSVNVVSGFNIIDIHTIRTIAALAGWVMWIKVFYWMRLFKDTSYFIILIMRTITDSAAFIVMLLIIFFAFANFNYILQLNVEGTEDVYVTEYIEGHNVFNSILAQYMVALGQFDCSDIGFGSSSFFAWVAFLAASYILTIVFMNLLIAIMGNTFGEVLEIQERAALKTFIGLMSDYSYKLDLTKVFKNQRYIIRVSPDVQKEGGSTDLPTHIKNVGKAIQTKQKGHHKLMMRKVQMLEKGTRNIAKNQAKSLKELKEKFTELQLY